jgi:hypothetical protein
LYFVDDPTLLDYQDYVDRYQVPARTYGTFGEVYPMPGDPLLTGPLGTAPEYADLVNWSGRVSGYGIPSLDYGFSNPGGVPAGPPQPSQFSDINGMFSGSGALGRGMSGVVGSFGFGGAPQAPTPGLEAWSDAPAAVAQTPAPPAAPDWGTPLDARAPDTWGVTPQNKARVEQAMQMFGDVQPNFATLDSIRSALPAPPTPDSLRGLAPNTPAAIGNLSLSGTFPSMPAPPSMRDFAPVEGPPSALPGYPVSPVEQAPLDAPPAPSIESIISSVQQSLDQPDPYGPTVDANIQARSPVPELPDAPDFGAPAIDQFAGLYGAPSAPPGMSLPSPPVDQFAYDTPAAPPGMTMPAAPSLAPQAMLSNFDMAQPPAPGIPEAPLSLPSFADIDRPQAPPGLGAPPSDMASMLGLGANFVGDVPPNFAAPAPPQMADVPGRFDVGMPPAPPTPSLGAMTMLDNAPMALAAPPSALLAVPTPPVDVAPLPDLPSPLPATPVQPVSVTDLAPPATPAPALPAPEMPAVAPPASVPSPNIGVTTPAPAWGGPPAATPSFSAGIAATPPQTVGMPTVDVTPVVDVPAVATPTPEQLAQFTPPTLEAPVPVEAFDAVTQQMAPTAAVTAAPPAAATPAATTPFGVPDAPAIGVPAAPAAPAAPSTPAPQAPAPQLGPPVGELPGAMPTNPQQATPTQQPGISTNVESPTVSPDPFGGVQRGYSPGEPTFPGGPIATNFAGDTQPLVGGPAAEFHGGLGGINMTGGIQSTALSSAGQQISNALGPLFGGPPSPPGDMTDLAAAAPLGGDVFTGYAGFGGGGLGDHPGFDGGLSNEGNYADLGGSFDPFGGGYADTGGSFGGADFGGGSVDAGNYGGPDRDSDDHGW